MNKQLYTTDKWNRILMNFEYSFFFFFFSQIDFSVSSYSIDIKWNIEMKISIDLQMLITFTQHLHKESAKLNVYVTFSILNSHYVSIEMSILNIVWQLDLRACQHFAMVIKKLNALFFYHLCSEIFTQFSCQWIELQHKFYTNIFFILTCV